MEKRLCARNTRFTVLQRRASTNFPPGRLYGRGWSQMGLLCASCEIVHQPSMDHRNMTVKCDSGAAGGTGGAGAAASRTQVGRASPPPKQRCLPPSDRKRKGNDDSTTMTTTTKKTAAAAVAPSERTYEAGPFSFLFFLLSYLLFEMVGLVW